MAGEITQAERHLRHLRETFLHVDATLRLLDPNGDPKAIVGKRPCKHVKLFGRACEAPRAGRRTVVLAMAVPPIVGSIAPMSGP
jgi:hypothetical protein